MTAGVNIAVVGVGNCCSALVQGIHYYGGSNEAGAASYVLHERIGGYGIGDIRIVSAFDIDARKVNRRLDEAVLAEPNCTTRFAPSLPQSDCIVSMSPLMDGLAGHMTANGHAGYLPSSEPEPTRDDVVRTLKESGAEILVNYLPVGAEEASRFYANCALDAGCAFVNNMPTLIGSDPVWGERFRARGLPVIGDDIKSQLGATIVHRALVELFAKRGVTLDHTYQLNVGGNTDFQNMQDRSRLKTKRHSKSEAVQSVTRQRLERDDIHVGPSDYVPWLKDNKVAFVRLEGRLFGDVPMNLELRLSVEDSPNSAGVAVDMIRCAKLGLERGLSGPLVAPAAYFCKHPPRQMPDSEAHIAVERFIAGEDGEAD